MTAAWLWIVFLLLVFGFCFGGVLLIVLFCFTLFVGYYCVCLWFVCYFDVWRVVLRGVLVVVGGIMFVVF